MSTTALLNQKQADEIINANKEYAKQILDASHSSILPSNRFVFFAAFDGTGNTETNINQSNEQTTNVAQLWTQYKENAAGRFGGAYFAGPGTPGTIEKSAWLSSAVTKQIQKTAQDAYDEFKKQASKWLENSKNEPMVSIVITGFSRGVASAAIFSQLLYEKGLKIGNKKIIAPEKIAVTVGILFDPVTTGVKCDVSFAPTMANVVDIFALNEYRYLFPATDYRGRPGITTIYMIGNHCDIGGGYDNGIGAMTLDAATRFLQECGLDALSGVPKNRKFNEPAKDKLIHSEGSADGNQDPDRPWSASRDFQSQSEDFDPTTRLTERNLEGRNQTSVRFVKV
jgi:hypothetical protein